MVGYRSTIQAITVVAKRMQFVCSIFAIPNTCAMLTMRSFLACLLCTAVATTTKECVRLAYLEKTACCRRLLLTMRKLRAGFLEGQNCLQPARKQLQSFNPTTRCWTEQGPSCTLALMLMTSFFGERCSYHTLRSHIKFSISLPLWFQSVHHTLQTVIFEVWLKSSHYN